MTKDEYEAIPWQEVESSNVARVAFRGTGHGNAQAEGGETLEKVPIGDLYVEFHTSPGRAYRYVNVPEALHDDLMGSASIGGFFTRNIRTRFEVQRIDSQPDES